MPCMRSGCVSISRFNISTKASRAGTKSARDGNTALLPARRKSQLCRASLGRQRELLRCAPVVPISPHHGVRAWCDSTSSDWSIEEQVEHVLLRLTGCEVRHLGLETAGSTPIFHDQRPLSDQRRCEQTTPSRHPKRGRTTGPRATGGWQCNRSRSSSAIACRRSSDHRLIHRISCSPHGGRR